MCGRYATFLPAEAIVALFQTKGATPNWAPTWNMAPTRDAPVIRLHRDSGERRLDLLHWGLVPHWAKSPKAIRMTINARAETLATTPMFRDAFAAGRRCLIPADAFYEWQATQDGKIPHAIARADGQPMAFAGLWEGWRGVDGTLIRSFVIITTTANDMLRPLHERMPVVLEPASWPAWLGEDAGDVVRADAGDVVRADAGDVVRADAGDVVRADAGDVVRADAGDVVRADAGDVVRADAGDVVRADAGDVVRADAGDVSTLLRPSAAAFRIWRIGTAVNHVRNDTAELLNSS